MADPIFTVQAPQKGAKRVSRQTTGTGPADTVTSTILINQDGVIQEVQNQGNWRFRVRGDGRLQLYSAPTNPLNVADGDLWYNGLTFLGRANGATIDLATGGGGGGSSTGFSANADVTIHKGAPVFTTSTGVDNAAALTAGNVYRVAGLASADATIGNPLMVFTTGSVVSNADWTTVAGTATLTVNANYFLSATPGQISTSMAAQVGVIIGRAISTTALLIDTQTAVIL